uniref:Uncharacterized protein n=1 Tax=Malurus cyaneus samueli TaxID=2593467 RepID=A0A8C5TS35_9PASS
MVLLRKSHGQGLFCRPGMLKDSLDAPPPKYPLNLSHPFFSTFFLFFPGSAALPSLNMAVKRREQTLQDYKRLQSKGKNMRKREDWSVLAKLHQVWRLFFSPLRATLEEGGGGVGGDPSSPIPPSPQQVVYYTEMHKIFGDLTAQIDRPGLSDEQRERENDAKLGELRALSIVADD